MFRTAGRIFGVVIVELRLGNDLGDRQGPAPHDGRCQFAPGHKFFDHDLFAEIPLGASQLSRGTVIARSYDENTDA